MYALDIQPFVQEKIHAYIENWKVKSRMTDEDLGIFDEKRIALTDDIGLRMQENFDIKIGSLEDITNIRVYSLSGDNQKQALIPSNNIFLFLTYEEDISTLTRYITDIEILRK